MTPSAEKVMIIPLTRLGRAYGKDVIQMTPVFPPSAEPGPKVEGKEEMGSARKPPRIGPITTPMLKHMGINRNARD
jgi:hypothetical protein